MIVRILQLEPGSVLKSFDGSLDSAEFRLGLACTEENRQARKSKNKMTFIHSFFYFETSE